MTLVKLVLGVKTCILFLLLRAISGLVVLIYESILLSLYIKAKWCFLRRSLYYSFGHAQLALMLSPVPNLIDPTRI